MDRYVFNIYLSMNKYPDGKYSAYYRQKESIGFGLPAVFSD